jgi:hypothetical protein
MLSKIAIHPSNLIFNLNDGVPISEKRRRQVDETNQESFAPTFAILIMFGGDQGIV